MTNVRERIAQLEANISQLSATKEMSQRQLETSLQDAHNLLQATNAQIDATKYPKMKSFNNDMSRLLEQMMQCAPANTPEQLRSVPKAEEILEQLTGTYQRNIAPMLDDAQRIAEEDKSLEKLGAVASMFIQVFRTSSELISYRKEMNTQEKVYAMSGTILMLAGAGLFLYATVSAAIPPVAGLTLLTLGCYLCAKAMQRHKSERALKVWKELDTQGQSIQSTAKVFDQDKSYNKQLLQFSTSASRDLKEEPKEKTSFVNTVVDSIKNMFNPKKD